MRQTDGLVTNLTAYNARGEACQAAIDMDADGLIDTNGTDRISEAVSTYGTFSSTNVQETAAYVYPTNGSTTRLEVSRQLRAVDGATVWSLAFDRTNHTAVARDRANAARIETVTAPDGTQTVSTYTNDLLRSVVRKNSAGGTTSTSSRSQRDGKRWGRTTCLLAPVPAMHPSRHRSKTHDVTPAATPLVHQP